MTMTIGSLFSGIGGLELGLEWAGVGHTVWQVEQDDYCRAVLATHWPDAKRFTDVCTVGAHNLPRVDVICGGFPRQDISYAGRGAGLAGARSGLWYEFARIVRELGPEYVVVENVRALLTRGLDAVLGTLADCGYDAEWSVLAAADVGAPHRRDRLFIVAHSRREYGVRWPHIQARHGDAQRPRSANRQEAAGDAERSREAVADADESGLEGWECGIVSQRTAERPARAGGASVADAHDESQSGRAFHAGPRAGVSQSQRGGEWWRAEPDVGRVADGVPARVDRLRALGNAVVPQVAEVVGRRLLAIHAERVRAAA